MKKWLPRFRLRSLLLFVTLFSCVLAYYVCAVERQKKAVAEIRELGGVVYYDYVCDEDGNPSWSFMDPNWTPSIADKLRSFFGEDYFNSVVFVHLRGSSITDGSLQSLIQLPLLKQVDVASTLITDEGLEKLVVLKELVGIDVTDTQVTESGVAKFKGWLPKVIVQADDFEFQRIFKLFDELEAATGDTKVFEELNLKKIFK